MPMKKILIVVLMALLGVSVMGCSTFKKMTGQRDDSILPGQREDILPSDAQTAKDPNVSAKNKQQQQQQETACDPADVNCVPPVDQESSTPQ
jgi:hypothetical protein